MNIRLPVLASRSLRTNHSQAFDHIGRMRRVGGPFHNNGAGSDQGDDRIKNAFARFMAREENRKLFHKVADLPVIRFRNGKAIDATGSIRNIYQGNWIGIFLISAAVLEMKISPERVKAVKCVEEEQAAGCLKQGGFSGSISRTVNLIFILNDGREVSFDRHQALTFFD